nr:transcription factor Ouib-like [Aedes albopictus]
MNLPTVKIEVPDPPTGEPESYCRFCYSAERLVSIFPATGNPHQRVIDLLKQLTSIKLNVLDDFPSAICGGCFVKLEEFDLFRRQCIVYHDETKRLRISAKACTFMVSLEREKVPNSIEGSTADLEHNTDVGREELSSIIDLQSIKVESIHAQVTSTEEAIENKPQVPSAKTSQTGRRLNRQENLKETKGKTKECNSQLKDYRCRICLQFFTNKDAINSHLLGSHTNVKKLQCLNCSKIFRGSQGLNVHVRKCYTLTSFACQHCDVLVKSKNELAAHESSCEQDRSKHPTPETPKPHPCDFCPKSFDSARQLYSHALLHEGKFACAKCGTNFHTPLNLKRHNERYHAHGMDELSTIVKCEPCQRTFVDASAYRSHHTRIHRQETDKDTRKLDEDKPFECDHCGKRFWSINTIRYHILVHRQYRDCDQCSESFRTVQQLKKHKLTAHPVKCQFCPKKYFSRKACRSHSNRTHGMIQVKLLAKNGTVTYKWRKLVFKCAVCELDYEIFRDLKDHFDRKHPEEKTQIKCSYCEKHISSSRIGYVGHVTGNCGQTPKKLKAWH